MIIPMLQAVFSEPEMWSSSQIQGIWKDIPQRVWAESQKTDWVLWERLAELLMHMSQTQKKAVKLLHGTCQLEKKEDFHLSKV